MSFRIRRIVVLPKNAAPNLDPFDGPGSFGNLLAAQTYLRSFYLPKSGIATAYVYLDQGAGNFDFGIYTGPPEWRRIDSTGSFASGGTGNILTKAIANLVLPAGTFWVAAAYSATGLGRRVVNSWPGYSQAGGPPLGAQLAPTVDDTANFPIDIGVIFA